MSKRNRKTVLVVILVALISSYVTYFINKNYYFKDELIALENQLRNELDDSVQEKINVAVLRKDIERYTLITNSNVDEYVDFIDISSKYLNEEVLTSKDDLINKVNNKPGKIGEILYYTSFADKESWLNIDDREKEISVKYLVADTVVEGNIIDLIINYNDGTYDVVLSKKKVNKIVNPFEEVILREDGSLEKVEGKNPAARSDDREFLIVLNLNEEEYELVTMASKMGYFETRKYLDESQEASNVTFDLSLASKQLNINYISKYEKMANSDMEMTGDNTEEMMEE